MQRFSDVDAYLDALRADPSLAVISMKMAASALGVSRALIERQLESAALDGVKVGKVRCVRALAVIGRQDAFAEKIAKVRLMLEDVAARRGTTTYSPVMEQVGMSTKIPNDRALIGRILGIISRESHRRHKFLLSALVFNSNAGKPSPSFFQLALDLGYTGGNEDRFLRGQLKRIWDHYATTP
jgi:hypothetical protein